jgi:hypothetical protein
MTMTEAECDGRRAKERRGEEEWMLLAKWRLLSGSGSGSGEKERAWKGKSRRAPAPVQVQVQARDRQLPHHAISPCRLNFSLRPSRETLAGAALGSFIAPVPVDLAVAVAVAVAVAIRAAANWLFCRQFSLLPSWGLLTLDKPVDGRFKPPGRLPPPSLRLCSLAVA